MIQIVYYDSQTFVNPAEDDRQLTVVLCFFVHRDKVVDVTMVVRLQFQDKIKSKGDVDTLELEI